jgi:plastocyanin
MRLPLLALLVLALAVAGCADSGGKGDGGSDTTGTGSDVAAPGSSSASQTNAPPPAAGGAPATHEVVMRMNRFEPAEHELHVGDSIHWTTMDVQAHNVVSESAAASFRSDDISIVPVLYAQEFTYTFTTPGSVDFLCEYHSGMVGTVTVT